MTSWSSYQSVFRFVKERYATVAEKEQYAAVAEKEEL
jgi:hypothetical protein